MKQQQAIEAADNVAGVAYSGEPHPFLFSEILSIGPLTMPEYLDRFREASASDLYSYLCRLTKEPVVASWSELPANMRCAFEVYRASYTVLMRIVRQDELAERERLLGKLGGNRVTWIGDGAVTHLDFDVPRRCRVCSCTDDDCSQCVAKTGRPCSWVEADLCSACVQPAAKVG